MGNAVDKLIFLEEERWLNGSAPDCKSVVLV